MITESDIRHSVNGDLGYGVEVSVALHLEASCCVSPHGRDVPAATEETICRLKQRIIRHIYGEVSAKVDELRHKLSGSLALDADCAGILKLFSEIQDILRGGL